jgi:[ribosomal protein S5]-alanine N-acetyltransferase
LPLSPLVESERLQLRLPEDSDVAAIVHYYRRNREHLQPWSPTFADQMFRLDYWFDQVAGRRAEFEAGLGARAFIFRREAPTVVIGNLSLNQITRGPAQHCVLGYSLAEDAQGRGYMLEAVRSAVRFAFGDLRLHRVMAGYIPHNIRSAAVLRRAGFTVEGYARDYILINGRWEDHILTAITNPDWSA